MPNISVSFTADEYDELITVGDKKTRREYIRRAALEKLRTEKLHEQSTVKEEKEEKGKVRR